MSISNNYDCIELTELSKVLYNTDYNTSNCAMLSDLNNIVKNDNPIYKIYLRDAKIKF